MLTLRETLLRTIEKNNSLISYTFPPGKVAQIAKEIEQRYSRAENSPTPDDLNQIRHLFLLAEKTNDWESINIKVWKKTCWILWNGDNPIAKNQVFLTKYMEFCNKHISTRITKALIHVYLRDYRADMAGQPEITKFIREQLHAACFKERLSLWKERDQNHNIFNLKKDFSINAKDYLSNSKQADDYLASVGLEGQLETANYAQELFEAIAKEIENKITTSSLASNLFEKLKDISISKEKKLRYPQKKYILIESLLRPWKNKTPSTELCNKILEFLLGIFHDPRTNEGRTYWVGVSDESQKTIRKWLAGATLEQFFEIIDSTAQDEHWRYRRVFWNAYYELGYIDDAWIALGKDSRLEARSQSVNGNELRAANIRGSGVKPDHSVLIFKVGELTICEWSHVGKCRIWFVNNKNSPLLYENDYSAEQLREYENFSISHHSSDRYHWQRQLSEYIENHTGIKIPRRKYEIKL